MDGKTLLTVEQEENNKNIVVEVADMQLLAGNEQKQNLYVGAIDIYWI